MSRDPMSLIVRLLHAPATVGRVVGHVEVVDTGEIVTIRSSTDFLELVRHLADREDT